MDVRVGLIEKAECGRTYAFVNVPCVECRDECISPNFWFCARMHAKSLQLCSTLCYPMDCSPTGSSVPGSGLALA